MIKSFHFTYNQPLGKTLYFENCIFFYVSFTSFVLRFCQFVSCWYFSCHKYQLQKQDQCLPSKSFYKFTFDITFHGAAGTTLIWHHCQLHPVYYHYCKLVLYFGENLISEIYHQKIISLSIISHIFLVVISVFIFFTCFIFLSFNMFIFICKIY